MQCDMIHSIWYIQYDAMRYDAVRYDTFNMIQRDMIHSIWYSAIWYSAIWYIHYDAVRYDTFDMMHWIWCSATWYIQYDTFNMMQCDMMQCDMIHSIWYSACFRVLRRRARRPHCGGEGERLWEITRGYIAVSTRVTSQHNTSCRAEQCVGWRGSPHISSLPAQPAPQRSALDSYHHCLWHVSWSQIRARLFSQP